MKKIKILLLILGVVSVFLFSKSGECTLVSPFNRAIAMEEHLEGHDLDPIEGVWMWKENIGRGQIFEVAIIPNTFGYKKYKKYEYVGLTTDSTGLIKEGQTKILLKKTDEGSYEGQYVFVVKDIMSKGIRTFEISVMVDKEGDNLSFTVPPLSLFSGKSSVKGEKIWPEKDTGPSADQPGTGTGFFIAKDIVVTNAHVVKGFQSAGVCYGNQKYNSDVIARDEINDIALLKVGFNNLRVLQSVEPLMLGDVYSVVDGEEVYCIGYPMATELGVNPKIGYGIINSTTGLGDDPRMFQISTPLQPGNSGGPLFNENGNVVGITSSGLNVAYYMKIRGVTPQNVNFAIKADYINNLLLSAPDCPEMKRGEANNIYKAKDIMEKWRDSVVLIICE